MMSPDKAKSNGIVATIKRLHKNRGKKFTK